MIYLIPETLSRAYPRGHAAGVRLVALVQPGYSVARLLIIVARGEPARYTYLRHVFRSETVDVILDRRVTERRQLHERAGAERRRGHRRHRYLSKDLQEFGWALVRR